MKTAFFTDGGKENIQYVLNVSSDFSDILVTRLFATSQIVTGEIRSTAKCLLTPTKHASPRVMRQLAIRRWGRSLKRSRDKHYYAKLCQVNSH